MADRIRIPNLVRSDPAAAAQALDEIRETRSRARYRPEERDFMCYLKQAGLGWQDLTDLYNKRFPGQNRSIGAIQGAFYRKDEGLRAEMVNSPKVRRRIAGNNRDAPLAPRYDWGNWKPTVIYQWMKDDSQSWTEYKTNLESEAGQWRAFVALEWKIRSSL